MNNPLPLEIIMVDLASIILGGFQESLISVFGDTIGWIIGHAIIVLCLVVILFAIMGRDHIISNSGLGRSESVDFGVFLLLTLTLYFVYTSVFVFASGASFGLAVISSLSIRWMVTILG